MNAIIETLTIEDPTVNVLNFQWLRDALIAEQVLKDKIRIGFNMANLLGGWKDKMEESVGCGTTACLAGWCYILQHPAILDDKENQVSVRHLRVDGQQRLVDEARKWLGITAQQAMELFGLRTPTPVLHRITFDQTIAHLDEIIAAGRYLRWDVSHGVNPF